MKAKMKKRVPQEALSSRYGFLDVKNVNPVLGLRDLRMEEYFNRAENLTRKVLGERNLINQSWRFMPEPVIPFLDLSFLAGLCIGGLVGLTDGFMHRRQFVSNIVASDYALMSAAKTASKFAGTALLSSAAHRWTMGSLRYALERAGADPSGALAEIVPATAASGVVTCSLLRHSRTPWRTALAAASLTGIATAGYRTSVFKSKSPLPAEEDMRAKRPADTTSAGLGLRFLEKELKHPI